MAINFPDSPSLNDLHIEGGRRWKWNGTVWERIPAPGSQGVPGAQGAQGVQGAQGLPAVGSTNKNLIVPDAYAVVGTASSGVGLGMNWGAYNSSTYRMEFTFHYAQPNANYYVHTNREHYATHNIEVFSKTTTGFTTKWTNSDGSDLSPATFQGVLIVYPSDPIETVGIGAQGVQGAQGATGATGAQGHQGVQGATGAQGHQGVQGAQGHQGRQGAQGVQGAQGAQGAQGHQGHQGVQGATGAQGHQGVQGAVGAQGAQGRQGAAGAQGAQGHQGVQGADGNFGGATFDYTFSTTTSDADPGAGKLRLNNALVNAATVLYIDDEDAGGTDIQSFLRTIDDSTSTVKGHFRISNRLDASDYALYTISGTNTEATGYHKVNCGIATASAVSFSNNEDIIITFARTGTKGDTGNTGAQGVQGAQGHQGVQGAQGHQGVQGATGAQGHQGVQGAQGHQGHQGVQGAQGRQGATGNTGAQGHQGVQGATGSTTTINNNADNKIITGSGTANTLNAESSITYSSGASLGLQVDNRIECNGSSALSGTPHTYLYGKGNSPGGIYMEGGESVIDIVSSDDGDHAGSILLRSTVNGSALINDPTKNAFLIKMFQTSADNFYIHSTGSNCSDIDTSAEFYLGGAVKLYHADSLKFETHSAGAALSGKLLVGTTSSSNLPGGFENSIQVEGTSAASSSISIVRNSDDINPPYLNFGKSRGTSVGSNTAVASGDNIGQIDWTGSDGSGTYGNYGNITVSVDGTPGNSDWPGRMVFKVGQDGGSLQERMRITSSGNIAINDNGVANNLLDVRKDATAVKTHIGTVNGSLSSMPNSSEYALTFVGGNAEFGLHKDGSGNYELILGTYQSSIDIPLIFRTGNRSERLRITQGGDVTTTGANFNRANAGITARAGDSFNVTRAGGTPLEINRTGSDGALINFFNDGSAKASVSLDSSDIYWSVAGTERLRISNGGTVTFNTDAGLLIKTPTNQAGATIKFTDNQAGSYAQIGHIKYYHSDDAVTSGYGEGFIIGGTESNGCVVRIDGGLHIQDVGSAGGGKRIYLGTGNDFAMWHEGSISYLSGQNSGQHVYIRSRNDIYLQAGDNSGGYHTSIYMDNNGGVQLNYDGNMRAKTISDGFQVHGDEGLQIYSRTNAPTLGARIEFSDHQSGSYAQQGWLYYKHSDHSVISSYSDCFVLGGNEAKTGFKVDADIHMHGQDGLFIHGTTDGVLNMNTTSSNGSFIRFKQSDSTKVWVGCSGGLGAGDKDDLGLRASDRIIFLRGGTARAYFDSNGYFKPWGTNTYDLGDSGDRWRTVYSNNSLNTSDINEKNTVLDCTLGLDFIKELRPVSYKWNYEDNGKTHYGLIAQEVEQVVLDRGMQVNDFGAIDEPQETVVDKDGNEKVGRYGLGYPEFTAPLIKAVQELSAKVESLEAELAALKSS